METLAASENGPQSAPDAPASARSTRGGARQGAGRKPRKRGGDRPSTYREELGLEICERLINGETLDAICRDPHMPESRVTVFRWRRQFPAFDEAYLAARGDQMEALADEVLEIAETEQDIQRARVKLDARRIVLGRLAGRYAPPQQREGERKPFDLAGAINEGRKRVEALIAELGHDEWKRRSEDATIESARNPDPNTDERILRAHQRLALHVLEDRRKAKQALLDMAVPEKPI